MLHEDQVFLVGSGTAGDRLGDKWLLPVPLRRIVKDGELARVLVQTTGSPMLIGASAGNA
jgi:hypothetical protein